MPHRCVQKTFLVQVNLLCVLLLPIFTHRIFLSWAADVMSDMGAEKIIAVDVGSQDNNNLTNYGDHISGWHILWNRFNPLATKMRVSGSKIILCIVVRIHGSFG